MSEKLTVFKKLTPVRRPMSFMAKGKKTTKSRHTSHCPTKTVSKTDTQPLNIVVDYIGNHCQTTSKVRESHVIQCLKIFFSALSWEMNDFL